MAEGHWHAPWEQCNAELGEDDKGKKQYGWGRYQKAAGVWSYRIVLDHCPLCDIGAAEDQAMEYGKMHFADQRIIDIEGSSFDAVRLVLAVSAYQRRR